MTDEPETTSRAVEMEISVDASPEAVWRALTDAGELVKWFPLEARVDPGVDGTIRLSWGEGVEGEARIDGWEPGRLLRWVEDAAGATLAVEFRLEGRGGGTRIRLVHSGFGADADWDAYYDGTEIGWSFFLRNLRHYLERHPGEPGAVLHRRIRPGVERETAWAELFGPDVLDVPTALRGELSEGDPVVLPLAASLPPGRDDGSVAGTAWMAVPGKAFAAALPDLRDSTLLVELEPGAEDGWHCGFWLYTWGIERSVTEEIDGRLGAVVRRAFGSDG